MNRIYKHYNFDLNANFVAARKMTFSSYPGMLESLDDFYLMDSNLTMVQTSLPVINQSIYDKVTPQALLAWQRVRLSNSMARTGHEWAKLLAMHNSGTYNNEYMVLDWNKFAVGKQLFKGALWVVDQIPGYVESADVTHQLERGYWPSYNVPYFDKVFNMSGWPALEKKYGFEFSYQMALRAQIFRRDQGSVVDLTTMKALMRYNDYMNDPYAHGNPGGAICARFDLDKTDPNPSGCYDTKVTTYAYHTNLISEAINGPTTSNDLPPFQWEPKWGNTTAHYGQPNLFNFDFVLMDPEW